MFVLAYAFFNVIVCDYIKIIILRPTICIKNKGGDNLSPPLRKTLVSTFHFFNINRENDLVFGDVLAKLLKI